MLELEKAKNGVKSNNNISVDNDPNSKNKTEKEKR